MAFRQLHSMAHDDDQLYDMSQGMPEGYEPPEYPMGLIFDVKAEDLARCGCEGGEPGDTMDFAAMATVTSIYKDMDGCRIELELTDLAGEDGQFCELSEPGYICLCERCLERLELEADCERGDMIHLIGTARMASRSDTEFGGERCSLQITDLSYLEDESAESREG